MVFNRFGVTGFPPSGCLISLHYSAILRTQVWSLSLAAWKILKQSMGSRDPGLLNSRIASTSIITTAVSCKRGKAKGRCLLCIRYSPISGSCWLLTGVHSLSLFIFL